MHSIDSDLLDQHGMVAVKDGKTHYRIVTKEGVNPEELAERLAQTKKHWKRACK
jgi:hypothetical protein